MSYNHNTAVDYKTEFLLKSATAQ